MQPVVVTGLWDSRDEYRPAFWMVTSARHGYYGRRTGALVDLSATQDYNLSSILTAIPTKPSLVVCAGFEPATSTRGRTGHCRTRETEAYPLSHRVPGTDPT